MAVHRYRLRLLELDDTDNLVQPKELIRLLRIWRKSHVFAHLCSKCQKPIPFPPRLSYAVCCHQFYYNNLTPYYPIVSIAMPTPGYAFVLPQLKRMIEKAGLQTNQEFLILPDPIFWQVSSTLTFEKVAKFVMGLPMTKRTQNVQPPSKSPLFYQQIQEAPLNYGSIESRSCGKATLFRQHVYGKRCKASMRGMIVPDPSLKANEIRLPRPIVEKYGLEGQFVIFNRQPTLHAGNFVALKVFRWDNDCFGVPLEILKAMSGDFDGDEINGFIVQSMLSQAELFLLLNSEYEMGSFVTGLKLSPCQDMLVAYYLFYDEIDFLPYKNPNLEKTFQVIYDVWGSKRTFQAFDDMRLFYLRKQEKHPFALTLSEIQTLVTQCKKGRLTSASKGGCLLTQVKAGAKGSVEHLKQMFGRIGMQGDVMVKNSFWSGLTPLEALAHAKVSYEALSESGRIWQPGYGYSKLVYNLHDIKVDYLGRLVDGNKRVVEKNVLDAIHHTDVMSEDTFDYVMQEVLVKKNFEWATIG